MINRACSTPIAFPRIALTALLATFVIGCASDGPAGTDPVTQAPTPAALQIGADTVRPSELITLRPIARVGALPDTIKGRLGATEFRAIRIDDSTLVGLVPAIAAGTYQARFVIGTQAHTDSVVIVPAAVIADPTATVEAIFTQVFAQFQAIEAGIPAVAASGGDTTVTRNLVIGGRAALTQARNDFLALTTEGRAQAAPIIASQFASLGIAASGSGGASMLAAPAIDASITICQLALSFEQCAKASETRDAIIAGARLLGTCVAKTASAGAVGGILGGVTGGAISAWWTAGVATAPGVIAGIKFGASVGAVVGLTSCIGDVWTTLDDVTQATVKPVLSEVDDLVPDLRAPRDGASLNALPANAFTAGTPRRVDVYAEFRSLSAQDASGPPFLVAMVTQFNSLAASWNRVRADYPILRLSLLQLPASPVTVVRKKVPAAYLTVTAITPTPITATAQGSDTTWNVTFLNPNQGDDRVINYSVAFTYPNLPVQTRPLTATLRPARYAVAQLLVAPQLDTIYVSASTTLQWFARDSTGDSLTVGEIAGRTPTWTSQSPDLATVGSSSGTVRGTAMGSATIRGVMGTGEATATVLVWFNYTGSYTLLTLNGITLPGTTFDDSLYTIETTGGGLSISADSTFTYSISALGKNKRNTETFDEGGSGRGTYTVGANGTALVFTTIETAGTPVSFGTGFIQNGIMTASVSTPDGAGSVTLRKN